MGSLVGMGLADLVLGFALFAVSLVMTGRFVIPGIVESYPFHRVDISVFVASCLEVWYVLETRMWL